MVPTPVTLIGTDAVGALEPRAYRRPGGKSTIKFACRVGSEIVVRVCREDFLFRADVEHAELRSLGFFAEARKLLLYCDAAQTCAAPWNEKALVNQECENRDKAVDFADYRDFTKFNPLTAAEVCRTFDPKSSLAPKDITYFLRWAPERHGLIHSLERTWSWESGKEDIL